MSEVTMPEKQNKRQMRLRVEARRWGVILALLMAIFEHHSAR